jgi:RNA polymerase sigma factor (sigma-70 family)
MDVQRTVEAVWRIESARLIAALARVTGDVGRAEDLAQDALVAALERWPSSGVPDNPGAWLTAVARRRYVDGVRRQVGFERRVAEIGRELAETENQAEDPMDEREFDTHVEDDVLRLIFTACHPVLPRDGRVALTLKLVGGLSTEQIARSFLVPVPTMAARITRAKRALREARVVFEVPVGAELAVRFADVLEVVYLIFNEGYAATSGESWYRADLCEEAMRLGRMLAALAPPPAAPEAHGLVALMEIQASRIPARTRPDGSPVTLLDQDRGRWNRLLITHGLAALARASSLSSHQPGGPGPYVIQAELAACHARAFAAADTDWARIVTLYEVLGGLTPSPVIELNRAVAVSMSDGPAAALVIVDALAGDPALRGYHLLPAVRGDLLARLGRTAAARDAFESAAALTANASEQDHLRRRAAAL